MAKPEERELRDLLEATQSKVRRLEAELAAREKTEPAAPLPLDEKEQAELRSLRERVTALEAENASCLAARMLAEEQRAQLETDVKEARREATRTRDETNQLRKELESTSQALEKSKARLQKLNSKQGRGGTSSLLGWVRGLFKGGKAKELEAAHKEISRLNQQLSLAQFNRRRGR